MNQPMSLPTVAVRAHVQRAVPPDSYAVIARAVAYGPDSATAGRELTARFTELESVIAGLAHLSLTVERGGVEVHPDWRSAKGKKVTRWRASRHARVIGRDTSQVADLVGPISDVTDVEIDGPQWELDRDNPVHAELAAEAVHEAIARAERYAAALGATLGRLVELTDTGLDGGGGVLFHVNASRMSRDSVGSGLETLDYSPEPIEVQAGIDGRWYLALPD